jgi:hypothetical protein
MNTINGNFIERSIPNIKNATLNLLIGDQVATMNLADFQAAIAPSSTSSGLKMKDNLPLSSTLNTVVDSNITIIESPLQLSTESVGLSRTVALSAGATNPRLFNEVYTINNSGAQTGTLTGLFLNATETALNGITHNLMDLQVGGVSKFKVDRLGVITSSSINTSGGGVTTGSAEITVGSLYFTSRARIYGGSADGNLTIYNSTVNNFGLLQLGGTTSSFPAIKRNGAAIDFRLADDSDYCALTMNTSTIYNNSDNAILKFSSMGDERFNIKSNTSILSFNATSNGRAFLFTSVLLNSDRNNSSFFRLLTPTINFSSGINTFRTLNTSYTVNTTGGTSAVTGFFLDATETTITGTTHNLIDLQVNGNSKFIVSTTNNSLLQLNSTTQGFLPPRMTTAQVNAIVTPANGLQVYNTDLLVVCFYDGTGWKKVSHTAM